jgi:4-carboxymuconolactone decarboxylase
MALAAKAGLPADIVEAVRTDSPIPFSHPAQEIVRTFIDEYFTTTRVSDDCYSQARDALGEQGVMDLITVVCVYSLVSMTTNVFDIRVPDGQAEPLPTVNTPGRLP